MFEPTNPEFLRLVRCPITKSELKPASEPLIRDINTAIENADLCNRLGQSVDQQLESGLINLDGSYLLPIREGIVSMIADQAIPLDQLGTRDDMS